ncbi:LysR family transcriptional regulator [Micromonospora fiedleri]|uniref:LysR family transcriptional regulator n=1 Tax=Micromonospora fiedleri TaxID=1157498 RepID=UPI0034D3CE09
MCQGCHLEPTPCAVHDQEKVTRRALEQGRGSAEVQQRTPAGDPGDRSDGTIVAAAAAEQLRLSPSAVSHQLATLEQEAGVALVDRGPRSLRLTVAGQRLADYAQQIADLMSAARDELFSSRRGSAGTAADRVLRRRRRELLPRALSSFSRGGAVALSDRRTC